MSSNRPNFLGARRPLSDADERRLSSTRDCFESFESFFDARASYPTGHPAVGRALQSVAETLASHADRLDRIVAGLAEPGFHHLGTGRAVWATETATSIAEAAIERDLRFLVVEMTADQRELHRLLDLLDRVRDDDPPPVRTLELDGAHTRLVAVDSSSALLAGVRTRRTSSEPTAEARAIHKLFDRTFDVSIPASGGAGSEGNLLEFSTANSDARADVHPDAQTDAVYELRRDLGSRKRTEVRRAAAICSALSDALDATTRTRLLDKARHTLADLLEQSQFDAANAFLEELELWQDELGDVLEPPLERRLLEIATSVDSRGRRPLLELLDDWKRDDLIDRLAAALRWRLPDECERDLVEFFGRRFERDADRLPDIVNHVTSEAAIELVDSASQNLPSARGPLLELLNRDIAPAVQTAALQTLRGHFAGMGQIDEYVVPLVGSPDPELRNTAIDSLVEIAPDQVAPALEPFINETLADRSEPDLEKLVANYARFGDADAFETLRELIRARRLGSDGERELSVRIVEALEPVERRKVDEMLTEIAREWTVASDVQSACKSVLQAHGIEV